MIKLLIGSVPSPVAIITSPSPEKVVAGLLVSIELLAAAAAAAAAELFPKLVSLDLEALEAEVVAAAAAGGGGGGLGAGGTDAAAGVGGDRSRYDAAASRA